MSKVVPLVEAYTAQQMLDLRQESLGRGSVTKVGYGRVQTYLRVLIGCTSVHQPVGEVLSSVLHHCRVSDASLVSCRPQMG